ncbi:hypothetical protein M422DRAFT_242010 [Sphaerobolus stellatus SS14]|nr:hypothetical protein M422DRAFT_242010 [Sphaerobolus stellatus SS14]
MSMRHNRKRVEEPSAPAVGEDEPIPGLTAGELTDPSPSSVDPQQNSESPIGTASAAGTSAPSQHQSRVAKASGTATQGRDSPQGIISSSDSGHNLGGAHDESQGKQ